MEFSISMAQKLRAKAQSLLACRDLSPLRMPRAGGRDVHVCVVRECCIRDSGPPGPRPPRALTATFRLLSLLFQSLGLPT